MPKNPYRDYLYTKIDNRERQVIAHQVYADNANQMFQKVLDEYGLASQLTAQLAAAKTGLSENSEPKPGKLKILDAGCGLGLYLQDVAVLIESRGMAEAASLYGVDSDEVMIGVATELANTAKDARHHLNFFVHDLTRPLEDCPGLFLDKDYQFDYIFSLAVFEYIADARSHIERLYQALKPGGVIHLRGLLFRRGPDAWLDPHPAFAPFADAFFQAILEVNGGVLVTAEQELWLQEAGAIKVQTFRDVLVSGGPSQHGKDLLRNFLQIVHSITPSMLQRGLVNQAQLAELMQTIYREAGPETVGQAVFLNTLAQKPFL